MQLNYDDLLMETYELREQMVDDRLRPRYHFLPPQGRWNDINGMIFWKGRYHAGYLQKIGNGPGERDFSSQQHISSRDLIHWRYHRASLREPLSGRKGEYFNSGGAIHGAEIPTMITNMPSRGVCVYQCHDDNLDHWVGLPENPVIPLDSEFLSPSSRYPECVIFDPSGWKEGDTYYALIGNKNYRAGYQGDSTSLFRSKDLRNWDYVGPFYKSERTWTEEIEDCACSDFFPFGDKHMLLMHTHRPYAKCQYYIGRYANEQFAPEQHGQLSWQGSMVFGPESLIDDRGRRVFLGTIGDGRDYETTGWTSIMTLPWHFSPGAGGCLKIDPVEELEKLRFHETRVADVELRSGEEVAVGALASNCMEVRLTLSPRGATEFGVRLLCSPDGDEETTVTYSVQEGEFAIDFERSSSDTSLKYPGNVTRQIVPYKADQLRLDIFVDRSVIEIFVNHDICIVQRVYPTLEESKQVRLFSVNGTVLCKDIRKWEMDASNPW